MSSVLHDDVELTGKQIQSLSSADELARFFTYLHYPPDTRLPMTPESLQLTDALANATRHIERLTSVVSESGTLQIYLFELTSVTVAHRRALIRVFRDRVGNFLLVLTDDYKRLDFVLLERELPGLKGLNVSTRSMPVRPRVLSVDRRDPDRVALRVLRRFTFTEADALDQFDKLSSAFTVVEWSEPLFNNRALFSDYYLNERLPTLDEWDDPECSRAFRDIRGLFAQARRRFASEDAATVRQGLIQPLLKTLGFRVEQRAGGAEPDFALQADGAEGPAVFVLAYPWSRYLDGKDDKRDDERPEENPGAQVVGLLERGAAPWGIVTNGKLWRLYSARAHSRATNYYEIDLEETLASPDPAEPFRYFYLFFRAAAFVPDERAVAGEIRELAFVGWLMEESTAYARELGERLKDRVFEHIFPHFAKGFIEGLGGADALLALPDAECEAKLDAVYRGTLTFLYRLLFLLYAESRDLLPVREVRGYYQISLQKLKEEIAKQAGPLEDQVAPRLERAYTDDLDEAAFYDRLLSLFAVIDKGSKARNVPIYNGGLFITQPKPDDDSIEACDARFLNQTKLPDRYLALGLDLLARDVDLKRGDLGFIDYKSLGVRQLGSIYEGLLEFKVRVAPGKMVVVEGKKTEEIVPYAEAKREKRKILTEGRGRNAKERTLPRGAVYLENDRRERKATGSYYTPDYIVKYIVRETVGPVLDERLADLHPRLQEAEQHFHAVVKRKREVESVTPDEVALLQEIAGGVLRDLFDVKVLDPAMGSGHFLVEAVDRVTDRLVRFLDGFPFLGTFFAGMRASILQEMERQEVTVDPERLTDVTLLKRHVLKRCIYGVDLNPMAVELAKVSLWLDCFTLGAPLSFLDHHLRWGNSLLGAMASDVEREMSASGPAGQLSFFTGPFAGLLRAADLMRTLSGIADVTLEQVHESRSLFDDFEQKAKPYKRLLDIHVAQHFGVERAAEFLQVYTHSPEKALAIVQANFEEIDATHRRMIQQTRTLFKEKRFFHWDLEFPEIFIDLEHAVWKKNGGFDVVLGNPPYANAWSMTGLDPVQRKAIETGISEDGLLQGHWDLYAAFIIRALAIARINGFQSFIVPDAFAREKYALALREHILRESRLLSIMHFEGINVFDEVSRHCLIYIINKQLPLDNSLTEVLIPLNVGIVSSQKTGNVRQSEWLKNPANQIRVRLANASVGGLIDRIESNAVKVGQFCYVMVGATVHSKDRKSFTKDTIVSEKPTGNAKRFFDGKNITRYQIEWDGRYLDYRPDEMYGPRVPELFESPKVVVRDVTGANEQLMVSFDRSGLYCDHLVTCVTYYENVEGTGAQVDYEGFERLEPPYPDLLYLTGIIASRTLTWYFREVFATGTLQGSYSHTYPKQVRAFPIRRIHFTTKKGKREQLITDLIARYESDERKVLLAEVEALLPKNEGGEFLAFQPGATGAEEKSDVIHDLLAHLAEQMIEMHKEKQQRVAAFWKDLEAGTSPDIFEALCGSGKWEATLAKDPACAPFVDAESRSTRTLDESLGWDEDCFQAFANLLAGKSAVTPPVVGIYREHHQPYKTLVERIAATDDLIDQIVYRLYGLTEEEMAMIEGEASSSPKKITRRLAVLSAPSEDLQTPLANTTDAQQLMDVLRELRRGAKTETELTARVAARSPAGDVPLWLIQEICREFRGVGWLAKTNELQLSQEAVPSNLVDGPVSPQTVHLELAIAHEQKSQIVSSILQRLFVLSPKQQGAIVLPEPTVDAPADVQALDGFVKELVEKYVQAMQQEYSAPVMRECLNSQRMTADILSKLRGVWRKMPPSKRNSRLRSVVREMFAQQLFGAISPPQEFIYGWVPRLAQAGLLMWARRLFDIEGLAIFPVIALRQPDEDFQAVEVEAGPVALQAYAIHNPQSESFANRFAKTLYDEYRALGGGTTREYVSLLSCRDRVCYRLRIGNPVFERLLSQSIQQSVRRQIEYSISLEADRTWAEHARQAMELPVNVNGPRYILSMKERS
jgi:hypothetical protein